MSGTSDAVALNGNDSSPAMRHYLLKNASSLNSVIDAIRIATGAPAVSAGISQNGQIIYDYHTGFADVNIRSQPTENTRYGIGSVSKAFTASAVAILVDDGKLGFDTRVKAVIPEFESTNPEVEEKATIRDLLGHTTGLAASNHWWYGAENEILIPQKDTMKYYNALQTASPFRSKYGYSNWGYTVAAEIIERVSGESFGDFVNRRIFEPLGMRSTTLNHNCTSSRDLAKPYAALDDASVVLLDQPQAQDGTIMAGAQGVQSTVGDMLKYGVELLAAYREETSTTHTVKSSLHPRSPLRHVAELFTPHVSKGTNADDVDAYGFGFNIHQLPSTLDGLGCNAMYTPKMPMVTPKAGKTKIMIHGGSLAGYSCMFSVMPDYDVTIMVCTNSIGLADPSQWIHQLLLEALVEDPHPTDYLTIATQAAAAHVNSSRSMNLGFERERHDVAPRPSSAYVGRYRDPHRGFFVDISAVGNSELAIRFQGRESQVWPLRYYKENTFMWLQPRDIQARRARFTYSGQNVFKIIFLKEENGRMMELSWPHDPTQPVKEQVLIREPDGNHDTMPQRL